MWLGSVPMAGKPGRARTVGWVDAVVNHRLHFYDESLPRMRLAPGLELQPQDQTASMSSLPWPQGLAQSCGRRLQLLGTAVSPHPH